MTREEAIEVLENGGWWDLLIPITTIEGRVEEDKLHEALDLALSALRAPTREQLEKVWRGEWVRRHRHRGGFRRVKGVDDMGEQHEVTIDERCEYDDLYCPKCKKQSPDNFLNFCGYCGEAFTDEAVERVMERLEELNNA